MCHPGSRFARGDTPPPLFGLRRQRLPASWASAVKLSPATLQEQGSENKSPTRDALPLRKRQGARTWLVFDLLQAETAGSGILSWATGSIPGERWRVCDASGRDKRWISVHHRVPGKSVLSLMLSLCPGCHAKVHRTKAVLSVMPLSLLELWREQHPKGHEQGQLNFFAKGPAAKRVPLFE